MTWQTRRKLKILGLGVTLFIVAYVFMRYAVPVVWPFIVAYVIARLIFPIVRFLRDKLHFHKNAAAILTLFFSMVLIVAGLSILIDKMIQQIMIFAEKWPHYQERLLIYLEKTCRLMENTFRMEDGVLYDIIYNGVSNFIGGWQQRIMPMVVNNSISTFMVFMDIIIVVALTVMTTFYMLRDMEKIRRINKKNIFYNELVYLKGLVSKILKAYVRTQAIILSVVAVICSVGLAIIGNDYYIVLGIFIGICDALPLLGVGTVLIPWTIVYIFMGNYIKAAILFTVFIVCYFIREFLEPRLMGQQIGISPISTLVSIYVGYKLFGFLGMIAGPLIFVLIREIIEKVELGMGHR